MSTRLKIWRHPFKYDLFSFTMNASDGFLERKHPMTTSLFILGGSLLLILGSAWWVLRG